MDYDFAVNSEDIDSVVQKIQAQIKIIDQAITDLYDEDTFAYNKLKAGDIWGGEQYEAFKSSFEALKTDYIVPAQEALKQYVKILQAASSESANIEKNA